MSHGLPDGQIAILAVTPQEGTERCREGDTLWHLCCRGAPMVNPTGWDKYKSLFLRQRSHRPNGEANIEGRWIAFLALGLMLGGCMQSTLEPAPETSMNPRDRRLLANAPYDTKTPIPDSFRRHIVDYHRKEMP